MRRYGLTIARILMLIVFCGTWSRINAQDGKALSYDTPVESQIGANGTEELWTLNAPGKDLIAITAERTGGTLAPRIELRDANGQRLAGAEVDYTYAKAQVREFDLPAPGTYTVAVGRYGLENGKTSGSYRLTVNLVGAGEDNPSAKPEHKPLEYGKPASGELTNARWREYWDFNAPGKDTISVTAKRDDGTVIPELQVLDSAGNPVNRAGNYQDGTFATVSRFQLPNPGKYSILVSRYSDRTGNTSGKYTVTLNLEASGQDRPDFFKAVGPVTFDAPMNGTLTDEQWANTYSFEAKSKDRLHITATRMEGSLIPEIFLIGANKQEINRARADETFATATLDMELPGPGNYEVRIQRQDGEDGYTTGKYELSVSVSSTGEDSPDFKTVAGEVTVGTPAKGTLTNAKWRDAYMLNLQSKDPLNITVKRTSGTLVPEIHLLGANQQEIYGVRADDTFATASLTNFNIPGPGQYTVVVTRLDRSNGQTSGGYELTVTQGKKE